MTFEELFTQHASLLENFQSHLNSLQEQIDSIAYNVSELEAPKFYFGVLTENIIEDNQFNLTGLHQYTINEFFNNTRDNYKYRLIPSAYPNFIKYILIPNDFLNQLTIQTSIDTHAKFDIEHAWSNDTYTLLDLTSFNNGNGITANFEMKLGGYPFGNDPLIESL